MSDDEFLTRVALHGSISPDDVPGGVELTDEEFDAVVEILFIRHSDEYRVYTRHHQTLFLDHGDGPFDAFDAAREVAIETALNEDLPLLQRVFTYAPTSESDELGADRIPIPWADNEDE